MELAEARAKTAEADRCGSALLSVEGVSIRFGGVTALDDVTFKVAPGAICGLIGPNGAGKTTLFNCISRLYDPQAGSIRVRRPAAFRRAPARDRRARHRAHVPERGAVRHHDDPR